MLINNRQTYFTLLAHKQQQGQKSLDIKVLKHLLVLISAWNNNVTATSNFSKKFLKKSFSLEFKKLP